MLCKYYLQLGTATVDTSSADCIDVSAMIKNLDAIKVSYQRVDLGGVVRKCGSTIEFTGKAYDAIIAHYSENYLQSSGAFAVFIADNNWNYSKAWECPLDFATLQYDANVCTIGCVDNSAAAVIKANKKSKYEFDVSSLKDDYKLRYNGVVSKKEYNFSVVGATPEGETTSDMIPTHYMRIEAGNLWKTYSLLVLGVGAPSPLADTSVNIMACDQTEGEYHHTNPWYARDEGELVSYAVQEGKAGFIKCINNCVVRIRMNMTFRCVGDSTWDDFLSHVDLQFILVAGRTVVWRQKVVNGYNNINIDTDCPLNTDDAISFVLSATCSDPDWMESLTGEAHGYFRFPLRWGSNTNVAYVNESQYSSNPIEIDVVKPISLLGALANKMFGDDKYIELSIIGTDGPLFRTLLVAAESFRRISTQKIYSSFADFCKFMESVYGHVYTVEDVGYYMDRELRWIDSGVSTTLSHIKTSRLVNKDFVSQGLPVMYRVNGIISEDLEDALDLETQYTYASFSQILYNAYANVFVAYDEGTGKYYANFVSSGQGYDSSKYNENGHAREMLGLVFDNLSFYSGNYFRYGIIRNGKYCLCDTIHRQSWLVSDENNKCVVSIVFKPRTSVFSSNVIKWLSNVNNISYSIDDGLIYSDVEVGYTKKDYDNANSAMNEFNFTNHYKADNNVSDNSLSLICPYRADCYGIEELLVKNTSSGGSDSEATKSDNDIFIVIANASAPEGLGNDRSWEIDRSITVLNAYTNTVFNAAIAPNKIILNNEDYIGCFVKELLKFTSSDGNSSAVIGGTSMSADIPITKQLFRAGKISVDTDDHNFPEKWEGLIEFEYAGKTYKGYLDSIDISFANTGTITYNLIEKCIE
jgi:hypothetical protein